MTFELNDAQMRVVGSEGSIAVTAGAGTGKTLTLSRRYLHHVREHGLSPLEVVAVTFTEKAADELRSRIRSQLREAGLDDATIAEVDAAQISTIHALCQRICRDFPHLAGIPADFTVLDEAQSPLWRAEKMDEAIGSIAPAIFEKLGYNWTINIIETLLRDPEASLTALEMGSAHWPKVIEAARLDARLKLIESEAWNLCLQTLPQLKGADDDKAEVVRANVLAAMRDVIGRGEIESFSNALKAFHKGHGAKSKWPEGQLDEFKERLAALRDEHAKVCDFLIIALTDDDELAAYKLPYLADAFRHTLGHLSAAKLDQKVLDFNDLERYALKILDHAEAVDHYRRRWKAIMVDEFQDTNPIQARIIRLICSGARLTIVGDEKQSIYGFRGADVGVFKEFRAELCETAEGREDTLDVTHRAHEGFINAANLVFDELLGEMHKGLVAKRQTSELRGPWLRYAAVCDEAGEPVKDETGIPVVEARFIADEINRLHDEDGVAFGQMAILSRKWSALTTIQDVLSAEGIPAVNAGGGTLLDTSEARDALSMLSFLAEPYDDIPLVAILRSPYFGISDNTLFRAMSGAPRDTAWWDLIRELPEFEHAAGLLSELLDAASSLSAAEALRLADRSTGYRAVIANLPYNTRRLADLDAIYETCEELASRGRGDVFSAARYFRAAIEGDVTVPRPPVAVGDAVSLMTIHKAKGLEWPVVFVPALGASSNSNSDQVLVDPKIGMSFKMEGDEYDKREPSIFTIIKQQQKIRERDELKRLLYVAVTRAKDMAILTTGTTGDVNSAQRLIEPSLEAAGITTEAILYSEERSATPQPTIPPGVEMPEEMYIDTIPNAPSSIPVTALSAYAKCPRMFRYNYIDGHPGIGEGVARAAEVGTLTHSALELDIETIEELRAQSQGSSDDVLTEAIGLARRFRDEECYGDYRTEGLQKELAVTSTVGGITLVGKADLVGDNFVADFKTDSEPDPAEHRFQLWAYARATGKPNAAAIYLRHGLVETLNEDDLAALDAEAEMLIARIASGDHTATPSAELCRYCRYSAVCPDRYASI